MAQEILHAWRGSLVSFANVKKRHKELQILTTISVVPTRNMQAAQVGSLILNLGVAPSRHVTTRRRNSGKWQYQGHLVRTCITRAVFMPKTRSRENQET